MRFKTDAWRLALVLAGVLTLAWAPYVVGGKTLLSSASDVPSIYVTGAGPRDPDIRVHRSLDPGAPGWQNDPWLALQHHLIFGEHVLPTWDPYSGYGVPFAASMITQPFYPLTFVAALDPGPLTYNILVLGRLFFLAFGCALFVRLFAGFVPALAAGICAAFSAYFILYVDIVHVGVEIMLPWILIGVELVVRRKGALPIAALAAAWGIGLLGGMPESSGLAGFTIALYAVFRIIISRGDRQTARRVLGLCGGLAVGTATAGIMLLPFLEYVKRDFDVHQGRNIGQVVGLQFDPYSSRLLLTEFAPLAFGPPYNNILTNHSGWTGVRGAPGAFALFFAAIAAITAIARFKHSQIADRVALFLVTFGCLIEAKRFGAPVVQWIGTIPILSLIEFTKYGEAVFAVVIACAAGFGVAALTQRRAGSGTILVAFILLLAMLTTLYLDAPVPDGVHAAFYYLALGLTLGVLTMTLLLALLQTRPNAPRTIAAGLLALAFLEGMCACFAPLYYVIDKPSPAVRNPFAGAPYVAYLVKATTADASRVIATGGDLFPNWSSAFGLYDPRYINAMSPDRFLPFVDAFVSRTRATSDDQYDRFVGTRPIDYHDSLVRRWMTLSSIAYAVSPTPLPPPPAPASFLTDLWAQTGPTIPEASRPAVRLTSTVVNGVAENALFEQPTYSDVLYTTAVPARQPWVAVDTALDPAVGGLRNCGGAVTFRLVASTPRGSVLASAEQTIDTDPAGAYRRWHRMTLDLRRFLNERIGLRFATDAAHVPNGPCAASAVWGEPRWTATRDTQPYREARTPDLQRVAQVTDTFVYRRDGVLPRIALFHSAQRAANGADALRALTDPHVDITKTVIVEGALPAFSGRADASDRVEVVSRSSQRLEAVITSKSSALVMQNDTWYPGWKATVDGQDAPIVRTDYLFRGVAVPAGRHRLVIEYRSPVVAAGAATSVAGILALLGLTLPQLRRRFVTRHAPSACAPAPTDERGAAG